MKTLFEKRFSFRFRFWILAALLAWFGRDGARGQQKQPVSSLQEDCGVTFSFDTASSGAQAAGTTTAGSTGTTAVIDNRSVGCLEWVVSYEPTSIVATVSLAFQTALDIGGVPTTWSNYPGTIVSGINPNTAVTTGGAVTETTGTAYPFLRMNMTVITGGGTIKGKLIGWKRRPPISATVAPGSICPAATPCVVDGPTASGVIPAFPPVLVAGRSGNDAGPGLTETIHTDTAGNQRVVGTAATGAPLTGDPVIVGKLDGAGVNVSQPFVCNINAFVNLSGSGNTQIVALAAAKSIRICQVYFSAPAIQDVKLTYGTGANCVTGTTDLGPLFKSVQSGLLPFGPDNAIVVPAANALCMNQSVAQANGVWVTYALF